MSACRQQELPPLTQGVMRSALEVLKAPLSPRDELRLMAHNAEIRRSVPTGAPTYYILFAFLLTRAERLGVQPARIRAVCHLIWGRPCYAGRGSLTLCEPVAAEGALTAAHLGSLEVSP
jgi:hypothetical protein